MSFDDFSHYNIYRTSSKFLPYSHIAKVSGNSYEDLVNDNGVTMYYKITVVDKDELESLRQDEGIVGMTLGEPAAPVLISANFDGSSIYLSWSEVARANSYTIVRSGGTDKKINGINATTYTDTALQQGQSYEYKIMAVDEYGITSKASNTIKVSTK
ncbi:MULTISPECIES: hypothetical protein [unclassified Campylobacter]|uniref:hypothetical protein n=1 Tax=unclassified Campylobacter TaxID=2593542 RepID=UPI003D342D43